MPDAAVLESRSMESVVDLGTIIGGSRAVEPEDVARGGTAERSRRAGGGRVRVCGGATTGACFACAGNGGSSCRGRGGARGLALIVSPHGGVRRYMPLHGVMYTASTGNCSGVDRAACEGRPGIGALRADAPCRSGRRMRDARCAMRDARCAMRDARCAMRDARCAMRDARCAMRDARCAMRDARCAMRDARCAMRDARCAMRDARCAWTLARPRSSRAPLTKWRMRGTYATSARRVTRRRPLPGVAGCCPRSDRNGTAGTRAHR
ncbi:hypothetical protein BBMA_2726 [Burkholderia pseudomallei MSHR1079]|nr:hypothetical protein BBMA_2726 [Burkholderia pseudomallei MSHR1079]